MLGLRFFYVLFLLFAVPALSLQAWHHPEESRINECSVLLSEMAKRQIGKEKIIALLAGRSAITPQEKKKIERAIRSSEASPVISLRVDEKGKGLHRWVKKLNRRLAQMRSEDFARPSNYWEAGSFVLLSAALLSGQMEGHMDMLGMLGLASMASGRGLNTLGDRLDQNANRLESAGAALLAFELLHQGLNQGLWPATAAGIAFGLYSIQKWMRADLSQILSNAFLFFGGLFTFAKLEQTSNYYEMRNWSFAPMIVPAIVSLLYGAPQEIYNRWKNSKQKNQSDGRLDELKQNLSTDRLQHWSEDLSLESKRLQDRIRMQEALNENDEIRKAFEAGHYSSIQWQHFLLPAEFGEDGEVLQPEALISVIRLIPTNDTASESDPNP